MPRNGLRLTIIAAIVVLCLLAATVAVAAEFNGGLSSSSTPVIVSVLGFIGTAVTALLALLKADRADFKTDAINVKVDGHMKRMIEAMLAAGVKPEHLPSAPPEVQSPGPTIPEPPK